MKNVLAGGVWYLDGGWQSLVNGLRASLRHLGVELRTGARATSVRSHEGVARVELASGEALRGRTAVVAIDPAGAVDLLATADRLIPGEVGGEAYPVRAACLDVALSRLPRPLSLVAFGLDRPLYLLGAFGLRQAGAGGVAVLHLMKYLGAGRDADRRARRGRTGGVPRWSPAGLARATWWRGGSCPG